MMLLEHETDSLRSRTFPSVSIYETCAAPLTNILMLLLLLLFITLPLQANEVLIQ